MKHKVYKNLVPLIILVLYSASGFIGLTVALAEDDVEDEARRELFEAFQTLTEAEREGADKAHLQHLAAKLNEALNLLEEAERLGRGEQAAQLAQNSVILSREVKAQAQQAARDGVQNAVRSKVLTWSLVLAASLTTTFTVVQGHSWYARREEKKLLAMSIRKKPEREES